MIFFVYAPETEATIASNIGLADYSYFFVMKLFKPILEQFGYVDVVENVEQVDMRYAAAKARNVSSLFLSFAPPHKTFFPQACPTIPVFAWEYSTIPNETWGGDWRNDWSAVLSRVRAAITHSQFAASTVRYELNCEYPIFSMPAPVWDSYAKLCQRLRPWRIRRKWSLFVERGVVLDSHLHGLEQSFNTEVPDLSFRQHQLSFDGIIYTTVFNPNDGRKNWLDLISAFCFAFQNNRSATLILKLVHQNPQVACARVWHEMKKLAPYSCRVVAIQGYLSQEAYKTLIANSTFIVNSAHGEGQCLPLMEFMSAGKPAIAPDHTGMADYICEDNAFVVKSCKVWMHWVHDPRLVLRTFHYRIDWGGLRDAFIESYKVATEEPHEYLKMSKNATARLRNHCSRHVISKRMRCFLEGLGYRRQKFFYPRKVIKSVVIRLKRLKLHH